jgi:predicted class III extradiol MEMO1 family dioxygenase
MMKVIRRATHAGSWYEDDEEVLGNQLQKWLDDVDSSQIPNSPTSVIQVGLIESIHSSEPLSLPVAKCKAIIAP